MIEPDLSNAAPFLALAAVTGGSVTVRDWPRATTQAGDALRDLLMRMGCEVTMLEDGLRVRGPARLHGIDVDLHDDGELTPAIAALCALATGPSHLRGIAHIRRHETDRLAALARELSALGAHVKEHSGGLAIRPAPLHGGVFHTYGDHRMAHAAVILGAVVDGVLVEDIETTGKTFPDFADVLGRPLLMGRLMSGRYYEEDVEHYERPRRHTRPRTKERPTYDDAVDGVVVTVDRGRFTLLVDGRTVMAMKARPLGRKGVVVGDRVRVVGDVSGADGSLARIVEVHERTTVLRRTADDDDPVERIIVANADQLVVVTALADPEPQPRLIDRALVAAFDAGHAAAAVPDQGRPGRPGDPARHLPLARRAVGGHPPRRRPRPSCPSGLRGRTSVLIGSSGVGKSTLVNALVPDGPARRRRRQRGHRPRPAHLDVGVHAGAARRRRAGSSTPRASGPSGSRTCSPSS